MPRRNTSTKHTPFRFGVNCANKRRFATEKEALKAAEYQMLLKQGLELKIYKCELCSGWHLTRELSEEPPNFNK